MSLWRFIIALCASVPAFVGGGYLAVRAQSVFIDQKALLPFEEAFGLFSLGGFLFAWLVLWLVTQSRPNAAIFFVGVAIWTVIPIAMYRTKLFMILETNHWTSLLPVMLILSAFAVFWLSAVVYRTQLRHAAKVSVASGAIVLLGTGSIAAKTYDFYHPPLPKTTWDLSSGNAIQLSLTLASLNERTDRVRTPCSYRYGFYPLTKISGKPDQLTVSVRDHGEDHIKWAVQFAVLTTAGEWVCNATTGGKLALAGAEQRFAPQAIYVSPSMEASLPGAAGTVQFLACKNDGPCSPNTGVSQ